MLRLPVIPRHSRGPRLAAAMLLAIGLLAPGPAFAERWLETEVRHHRIYAPERLARYAEEVAAALTRTTEIALRWGYAPPEPTTWVLRDEGEWFNGSAWTLFNRIELYGMTADFDLRGHTPWVPNVVAHEFAHLATLDRARRMPRWLGGIVLGGLDEGGRLGGDRRVKGALSLYIPSERVPRWFSEGIAQLESEQAGADAFDTTRAMLEREAWRAGALLSLREMGSVAGKDWFGGEQVYNQGYSWLRFLHTRGGDEGLRELLDAARTNIGGRFDRALAETYGQPVSTLEAAWRAEVAARSRAALDRLPPSAAASTAVADGRFQRRPVRSPDGRQLAWLSDGDVDYPIGRLVLAPADAPEQARELARDVEDFTFTADGSALWYVRRQQAIGRRYPTWDLFRRILPDGREERFTDGARVRWPAASPDGTTVVVSIRSDGGWNLAMLDVEARALRTLSDLPWGWELRESAWGPDGRLWASLARPDGRVELVRLRFENDELRINVATGIPGRVRAPRPDPAGELWLIHDSLGSHQLWRLAEAPTTEPASVLLPASADPGGILYAAPGTADVLVEVYRHHRFELRRLARDAVTETATTAFGLDLHWQPLTPPAPDPVAIDMQRARFRLGRTVVFPQFQWLYGEPAGGVIALITDDRGRHDLQLEALLGRSGEVNAAWTWRGSDPMLSLEARRYWGRIELSDDGHALPITYDTLRASTLMPIGDDWAIGGHLRADRLGTSVLLPVLFGTPANALSTRCGGAVLLCGVEAGLQGAWSRPEPYVRNAIDFRGAFAYADATRRRSRALELRIDETSGAGVVDERFDRFMRLTAGGIWARGFGRLTLETAGQVGWIPAEVSTWDELYLGGHIFQLRRGELRSYSNMPGYADFSIHGEKLLLARAALRWTAATRLGGWGPFLFDAIVLELAADAGNAWDHAVGWGEVLRGIAGRPAELRPDGVVDPTDARWQGLLYGASFDVRLGAVLFDSVPWHSFLRLAHGFQDPALKGDAFPLRIYLGIGTGL